jgi:hypothetical protein
MMHSSSRITTGKSQRNLSVILIMNLLHFKLKTFARVSLVREVAYPSHRRVDCRSPRRAEELGKEEVESQRCSDGQ